MKDACHRSQIGAVVPRSAREHIEAFNSYRLAKRFEERMCRGDDASILPSRSASIGTEGCHLRGLGRMHHLVVDLSIEVSYS